jgi:ribonuclease P protein component
MPDHTFRRDERLKSRKVIQRLFKEGNSFSQYPLRLVWLTVAERRGDSPVQFSVSVPKKKFKRAVQRNRIRRQVREAYRLNKHRLYRMLEAEAVQGAFMVIYTAAEALPYEQIEAAMRGLIRRFAKKYGEV